MLNMAKQCGINHNLITGELLNTPAENIKPAIKTKTREKKGIHFQSCLFSLISTNGIFIPLGSLAPSSSVTLQQRCIFKFFGFATLPNKGHMRWQTHCSESNQQEAEHGGAIKKMNGAGYLRGRQMGCVHPCENTNKSSNPCNNLDPK